MELVFVTGNANKVKEAEQILDGYSVVSKPLELTEVQGEMEDIIKSKLDEAYRILQRPLFVDDTGLFFDSLNGLPGPYIKDFLNKAGRERLAQMANLDNNGGAVARCYIGFIDENQEKHIFTGEVKGRIVKPQGENNFGWDPIFMPDGYGKTYAELDNEEKNKISHRKRALEAFSEWLRDRTGD